MWFDIKFVLRRKALLVSVGNITVSRDKGSYFGVVNIDNKRASFLILKTNIIDLVVSDVGNAYIYGFTNEKPHILEEPEFDE